MLDNRTEEVCIRLYLSAKLDFSQSDKIAAPANAELEVHRRLMRWEYVWRNMHTALSDACRARRSNCSCTRTTATVLLRRPSGVWGNSQACRNCNIFSKCQRK
jgi:hypothetical protein